MFSILYSVIVSHCWTMTNISVFLGCNMLFTLWANKVSCSRQLLFLCMGVKGSSVLSPTLLAVNINDTVSQLPFRVHRFVVIYADDIMTRPYLWYLPLLDYKDFLFTLPLYRTTCTMHCYTLHYTILKVRALIRCASLRCKLLSVTFAPELTMLIFIRG